MTDGPIRVVIVDDQPLFAAGLAMLIDAQPDMRCVATAHDGNAAVTLVRQVRPDVVLMDLRMPGLNGLEATQLVVAEPEPPKVVVLTTIKRDEAVYLALRAGASALLTKDALPAEVLGTIREAVAGERLAGASDTVDVVREFANRAQTRTPDDTLAALSAREREVFLLIARGLSNAEIAEATVLTEATVKSHVRQVLAKLGLKSRVQVVAFAYENELMGAVR
ncbi:response regulator transcription factor [Gryllotalpicola koreensis]|uniref:Response regulator transcription factor n=1 Tax=Gryllotalpicola koreensis TaxID=993086 RepID=A0ABP8A2K3_9MICO